MPRCTYLAAMASTIRIAIVEDDDELRALIRRRIERSGDMQVVRVFESGDDYLVLSLIHI